MATLSGWKTFKSYANMATSKSLKQIVNWREIFQLFSLSTVLFMAHGESNNFPPISPLSWLRYRFHEHERCLFILWNTCCGCLHIHLIFRLTEKHYSLMLPFLYKRKHDSSTSINVRFHQVETAHAGYILSQLERRDWVPAGFCFPQLLMTAFIQTCGGER
jgi:hypothetical protein